MTRPNSRETSSVKCQDLSDLQALGNGHNRRVHDAKVQITARIGQVDCALHITERKARKLVCPSPDITDELGEGDVGAMLSAPVVDLTQCQRRDDQFEVVRGCSDARDVSSVSSVEQGNYAARV